MSQKVLKAGTPENPLKVDVTIVHGPKTVTYYCQRCEDTFTDTKDEARVKYLKHQIKKHQVKYPKIHSFDEDETDEWWMQNYL